MQIKVFKAATMKEAVAAMRAELGSKAVILHSKKYKESGLLGLRTREVVEITAAVEDSPEKQETISSKPVPVAQPANIAAAKYKQTPKPTPTETPPAEKKVSEADVQKLQSVLKRVKENSPIEIESQSDAEILNPPEEPKKTTLKAQRIAQRQQRLYKAEQLTESPPEKISTPKFEKISTEEKKPAAQPQVKEKLNPAEETPLPMNFTPEQMAQFQQMMFAQFQQMQAAQQTPPQPVESPTTTSAPSKTESIAASPEMPPAPSESVSAGVESAEQKRIKQLEDELAQMKSMLAEVLGKDSQKATITLNEALKRQDVSEEILNEMSDTSIDYKSGAAKWTLSSYFSEHIKFAEGIKLSRRGAKIVALVGTTGVGKTTTLAKIAAKFVLEQGIGAALITADTYRISAVEQLKTYSDILGLPIEIVYTPQELALAIEQHQDKELILIDTAGRSQYSDAQMYELQEFLKTNPRIEKHLVISASVKLNDAKEIVKKFSVVEPEKIIITKIDETSNFGTVINLLRHENLPLSYLTTGQSVPDDIEIGNAETLTDLMIKKINAMLS